MTGSISKKIKKEGNVAGPISKQFLIDEREYNIASDEILDPIGDDKFEKCKGVIHRYPDRALLIPKNDCLVQCRFCFRKWKLPEEKSELNNIELDMALDYFRKEKNIWEVVITGGEPLAIEKEKLRYIVEELHKIDHIKVIRFHTRSVIVEPSIIDDELMEILKIHKPTYVVIHCNHPDEISDDVSACLDKLVENGIVLLSQSALLKGVNDDSAILESLFRRLVENRVKPYYLHHCDLVPGTSHFRTSIEEGQNLLKGIRGRVSGVCWPTYVLDIPNGYGKVPLGPNYYEKNDDSEVYITDYQGQKHSYPDKKE